MFCADFLLFWCLSQLITGLQLVNLLIFINLLFFTDFPVPAVIKVWWYMQVAEFDISRSEFTSWSQQFTECLPLSWSRRHNKIRRLFYHPRHCDRIVVYDDEAFCIIDKSQVLLICVEYMMKKILCFSLAEVSEVV